VDDQAIVVGAGIIIAMMLGLFGFLWSKIDKMNDDLKDVSKFDERIKSLDKDIKRIDGALEKFQSYIIEIYEKAIPAKEYTGNPISNKEKLELISKLKKGTLDRNEAERLSEVLKEEKEDAEDTGNTAIAIATGLLLGALAYYLYRRWKGE